MKNMEKAVRMAEGGFFTNEPQEIKISRDGRKIEIAPEAFGWIWSIEYASAKEAAKAEKSLGKLENSALMKLHREANENIRFRVPIDSFDVVSQELIENTLSRLSGK